MAKDLIAEMVIHPPTRFYHHFIATDYEKDLIAIGNQRWLYMELILCLTIDALKRVAQL